MPTSKVREYLENHKVKYTAIKHSTAYTAQEMAASAHIPGRQLAKTVMIKIDGEMAMAVLPAPYRVDFARLKKAAGAKKVEMATEQEFQDMFPDCEVGAMPPFGNLYGMGVFVDARLSDEVVIAFCGGTHTELIRMSYQDFERLVDPKVAEFSVAE